MDDIKAIRDAHDKLAADNANLRTVMIAAAEEISAHWPAYCDDEGYGPQNLLRRLEEGIPSQYGYTAGAFANLKAENARLLDALELAQKDAARYRWLRDAKRLDLRSEGQGAAWKRKDGSHFYSSHILCAGGTRFAPAETLDAAIDAAMSAAPQSPAADQSAP